MSDYNEEYRPTDETEPAPSVPEQSAEAFDVSNTAQSGDGSTEPAAEYAAAEPAAEPAAAESQYSYTQPQQTWYQQSQPTQQAQSQYQQYQSYQQNPYQGYRQAEQQYQSYQQPPYRQPVNSYQQTAYQQNQYASYQQATPAYQEQLYNTPAEPAQKPKKKHVAARVIAWVLVLCILGGMGGFFFTNYQIQSGNNGTLFSVVKRGSAVMEAPANTPAADPAPSSSGAISTAPVASTNSGNPDGPKLEITEAPAGGSVTSTAGELSVADIAAKCTPSVVGITASIESAYYGMSSSVGTGIIMSTDGYIITNNHVIDGASYIVVTLMDESTHDATLIGCDERSDLAVLKIDGTGLNLLAAEFGDSDALVVGDPVVAIGNPLGLDFMGTVTNGIVSAINRNVVVDERNMTLIQTNAAINSGNSGGPLINKYGQVIGINTLKMQDYSTTVEGLGFAIPTNTAKDIIDELIEYGYVKGRPALGIRGRNIDAYTRQRYNVPYGVMVYSINTLSNAYNAGLRPGDIITQFNGELVYTVDEINTAKADFVAGDTVTVTYYRDGTYSDISFALNDEALLDAASETTSGGSN